MNTYLKSLRTATIAALFSATALAGSVNAEPQVNSLKLLTAKFNARQVVQVEVGDFHFKPGQIAPVHIHKAPAVGYVAKGTIIYQVEGEKVQILHAGDAFYEPVGKRILRFDNASATQEAIFLDFNLERKGDPFIVFEEKPKEAIDRRTLPTIKIARKSVDQVDIYTSEIKAGGTLKLSSKTLTLGLVAQGVVELRVKGKKPQRIIAGRSFPLANDSGELVVVNTSSDVPAKVITFRLR